MCRSRRELSNEYLLANVGFENEPCKVCPLSAYRSPRFSYGVANRGCSVRIPRDTDAQKYGYFEDRRPASNMDPYIVTKMIVQTCCL